MDDIFVNNSILVVPNNIKEKVLLKLNEQKEIYNIKIISLNELINSLTFSYDEQAIYYIIKEYNIKYEVALTYLKNLKYIENKHYNSEKLNNLLKLKKELDKNNLLIYDTLFNDLIKNKKIILYGFDYINTFEMQKLKEINATILEKKYNNYVHEIHEFSYIDDEIEYIANEIIKLINKGININNIKLANINDEYMFSINKIFNMYNLNINLKSTSSIYSTNIVKDFFKYLNKDINITLSILKERYDIDSENNKYIYNSIIKILNKYYFIQDYTLIENILKEELKRIKTSIKKYKNAIEVISLKDNIISDDEYVFLIGFNQTIMPKIYKDEDYISDKEKALINLETSTQKNIIEKKIIYKQIKNIKNLVITYKLKTAFNSYFPSSLIDELGFTVIKNHNKEYNYSNINNKINLAKQLDNYIKYGEIDPDLSLLYTSYPNNNFMTFNNKFKGINTLILYNLLNNKLTLSYSSMDTYNNCAFKYYLKSILKVEEYEETFATFIGNLFHYILSKCFKDDFNFENEFNNYIKEKEFSFKDKFYLEKLRKDLLFIIKTIKRQYIHMDFKKSLYEDEVKINLEKNIKITFKGYIDKILYKEEDTNTYVIIIDYKTGNPELNLNNSIYGINLQLPVYLYLTKNNNKLKNVKILGFYLQKILNNSIKKVKNKSYDNQKEENLKLQGYTIDDINLIEKVDDTYENSEVIKSLKLGKNGFYSYSKVISEENIEKLISLTENKVNESIDNILNGKFDINPKKIGNKIFGCEFCSFKDICYMTNNDIVNFEEYKDLEFLK